MNLYPYLTPYTKIHSKWFKINRITESVSSPSWWPTTFTSDLLTIFPHCFKTFNTFVLKGSWLHYNHSVT